MSNVVAIAAGYEHSLALTADGKVLGWGEESALFDWGQIVPPSDLTNATRIATGGYHSLAVRQDGSVSAWGSDQYG